MVMNVKALRHHGSIITPPPPAESPSPIAEVLVRYFVDGATPVDTLADGTQTFPYPDGPFRFWVLAPDGSNPPLLDVVFNTASASLYNSLVANVDDLGGGLTQAQRIAMNYGLLRGVFGTPSIHLGTTFEAQCYLHNPTFPLSQSYGPLLTFACDPDLHNPVITSGWYVNRCTLYPTLHQLVSVGPQNLTYPNDWSDPDIDIATAKARQGTMILLPFNNILWGTMSRLQWVVTQLGGPTRHMNILGFYNTSQTANHSVDDPQGLTHTFSCDDSGITNGELTAVNRLSDARNPPSFWALEDLWSGLWYTDNDPASSPLTTHNWQSFIIVMRNDVGFGYAGTSFSLQAKFGGVDFGPPIILSCEV